MTPAQDTARMISAAGVGALAGKSAWSIFVGTLPSEPASAVAVYDTEGATVDTDEMDIIFAPITVRVRGKDYAAAHAKCVACREALISVEQVQVGKRVFAGFAVIADVASEGPDDSERYVFSASFRALITELP